MNEIQLYYDLEFQSSIFFSVKYGPKNKTDVERDLIKANLDELLKLCKSVSSRSFS